MNPCILFFSTLIAITSISLLSNYLLMPRRLDLSIFDNETIIPNITKSICLETLTELSGELFYQKHFTHRDYRKLLPCMLDLDYDFHAKFHVILIGSTSAVAISLMKMLKEAKIEYVEIRGRIQFNLLRDPIWDILHQIQKKILIIDLHHIFDSYATEKINEYAEQRKIPIVRLVSSFQNNDFSYQLKIPMVFGPSYHRISDCVNARYFDCFLNLSTTPRQCPNTTQYVFSYDVAKYIFDHIPEYKSQKINSNFITPDLHYYSENEVSSFIAYKHPRCISRDDTKKDEETKTQKVGSRVDNFSIPKAFEIIEKDFHSILPNITTPYVSHVTTVSDLPRVINCYQLNLNAISLILPDHPMISVEFVCVYSSLKDLKFEDLYEIPSTVAKYHRVIHISSALHKQINEKVNGQFFPEYIFRNIGARNARGTYIICGSSDVLMPPAFFIAAEQLLFSPLSYMRSRRESILPIEINRVIQESDKFYYSIQYWLHMENGLTHMSNSLIVDACGDFQGCHRLMWEVVRAYVESDRIFHVDSAFAFDLSGFLPPLLVRFMPAEKHISHIKISTRTPHLQIFALYNRGKLYNGFSSRHAVNRPNWGHGTFDDLKLEL
ncbi:hypothetical protein TRFO_11246 [Tritrichomonas foetus]|uniref:Uncharacterized protein n=1 Tax=Tritrichomonas foetus TaxID=1144522 RepID=A0A1J4JA98_9EUKA|nr:hypothetical protein TRFO_11246 [Tritrichomonas foetus]|eukprot:OHS94188.1 hypothetical protein TRFO_11246 [Tritrichomonas foetus]